MLSVKVTKPSCFFSQARQRQKYDILHFSQTVFTEVLEKGSGIKKQKNNNNNTPHTPHHNVLLVSIF